MIRRSAAPLSIGLHTLFMLAILWGSGPGQQAAADTRVLIVATPPDHPWGSHMYAFDGQLLAELLQQTPGVQAETALGWPVQPRRLEALDAIVFYSRPAGEIVLHPDHRHRFTELMERGTGLVCIHWATGVGYTPIADQPEIRDAYRNLLGGWFRRPPCDIKIGTARLHQSDPAHPICRGWREYEIHDEFYLNPVLDARTRPLLQVRLDGQDQTVGWTFERADQNRGRSVGITLAHFHENFKRAEFRTLLVNAILWSARLEIPDGGAPVEVEAARLALPAEK